MPTLRRSRWLLAGVILLLAVPLAGCARIAKVIPGNDEAKNLAQRSPTGTPTPIFVSPSAQAAPGGAGAATLPDSQLALSVVQVQTVDASVGSNQAFRNGSGVVVDASNRLILTSYELVVPFRTNGTPGYTTIVIATNRKPGEAPAPEFEAELAAADPPNDIAVLRVVRDFGAKSLTPGKFNLPATTLGDARSASAGLPLRLFGYPGLAPAGSQRSQLLMVSKATVTGLRGIAGGSGRSWLKTDAHLPYGNGGGAAFNQAGALIGILAQDRYLPTGEVGQVRPLELALAVIDRARKDTTGTRYQAPLYMTGNVPGTTRPLPTDGIWISRPSFGENAIEAQGARDIFDYETRFVAGRPALYYEYVLEGVPAGTVVEERWFLDDVQQDQLSSSYRWDGRGLAIAGDRIAVLGPGGIPRGRWRLEIWAAGVLRAQSTALLGVELHQPQISGFADGSAATPDATPASAPAASASQLLVFFDFKGWEGVQQLDWLVFHDNQYVYTSPPIRWMYGDSGRFWIGFAPGAPLGPGKWDLELHADGRVMGVLAVTIR